MNTFLEKLRAFLNRNKSVDGVVSQLNQAIAKLDALTTAKYDEANDHADAASESSLRGEAALREARRAGAVHDKLTALVS